MIMMMLFASLLALSAPNSRSFLCAHPQVAFPGGRQSRYFSSFIYLIGGAFSRTHLRDSFPSDKLHIFSLALSCQNIDHSDVCSPSLGRRAIRSQLLDGWTHTTPQKHASPSYVVVVPST